MATRDKTDLLRGTLDLLILKTLTLEPLHGVAIADRIAQVTSGTFRVQAGSLFPALHRLEASDLITGEWTTTPDGRRIKSYALTAAGKRQLNAETKQWERIVTAMSQVLQLTWRPLASHDGVNRSADRHVKAGVSPAGRRRRCGGAAHSIHTSDSCRCCQGIAARESARIRS